MRMANAPELRTCQAIGSFSNFQDMTYDELAGTPVSQDHIAGPHPPPLRRLRPEPGSAAQYTDPK